MEVNKNLFEKILKIKDKNFDKKKKYSSIVSNLNLENIRTTIEETFKVLDKNLNLDFIKTTNIKNQENVFNFLFSNKNKEMRY